MTDEPDDSLAKLTELAREYGLSDSYAVALHERITLVIDRVMPAFSVAAGHPAATQAVRDALSLSPAISGRDLKAVAFRNRTVSGMEPT